MDCCSDDPRDPTIYEFPLKLEQNCTLSLPIYQEKSIKLDIHCDTKIDIWLIVKEENVGPIFHSNFSEQCSRTEPHTISWQAPKSTGLKIFVQSEKEMEIKVTVEDDNNVCGYPYVKLTENSTIVQKNISFTNRQDCVYRLVPNTDAYNKVEIKFNIEDQVRYEQRIYRAGGNFETKLYEGNRQLLLEQFDLKMDSYDSPPEITAVLHHDQCIDGIHTLHIHPENTTTDITLPSLWADRCPQVKSIYKIQFVDMKPNELVVFKNNFEFKQDIFLKLKRLDTNEPIMNRTHWLETAAINTTGLYFELLNKYSADLYKLTFSRVQIAEGCNCSSFDEKIYDHSHHFKHTFPSHCKNIFCHWGIVKHGKKNMNVKIQVESPSSNDFFVNNYQFFSKHQRIPAKNFEEETSPHVPRIKNPEIAFYRLNASAETDTTIHVSWDFSLYCECPPPYHSLHHVNEEINVTSQNWPEVYCTHLRCETSISTSDNLVLEISINEFQLDAYGDHLSIFNGSISDENKIAKWSGEVTQSTILAGNVTFLFESNDDGTNDKGYHLTVRAVEKSSTTTTKTTEATTTTLETTTTEKTTESNTESTTLITTTEPTTTSTTTTIPSTTTSTTPEPLISTSTTSKSLDPSYHSSTFAIMSFLFLAILLVVVGFLYQQRNLRRQTQRMLFSADPPNSLNMPHNSLY